MALFWVMTAEPMEHLAAARGVKSACPSPGTSSPPPPFSTAVPVRRCHGAAGLQHGLKSGHCSEGGVSPARLMDASPTSLLPCQGLRMLSVLRLLFNVSLFLSI